MVSHCSSFLLLCLFLWLHCLTCCYHGYIDRSMSTAGVHFSESSPLALFCSNFTLRIDKKAKGLQLGLSIFGYVSS